MKLWLLGTGTPTPSTHRVCSGYLVQAGNDMIVFDHGFGSHGRLLELGVGPDQITHAFFSHHHYDHMGDYARLVLTRWDHGAGAIPDLKVYGPPPLKRITERLFDDDGAFGPDIISRTQNEVSLDVYRQRGGKGERARPAPIVRELEASDRVREHGWTVSVAPVHHFSPHLISYGYRIDHEGESIVYSGDTGPCRALVELAMGCDVLVHMCHYQTGTAPSRMWEKFVSGHMEVAETARQAGAKNLVVSHVAAQIDKPGVRERLISEMKSVYAGNLFFGEDKMEIPVGGPSVAHLD